MVTHPRDPNDPGDYRRAVSDFIYVPFEELPADADPTERPGPYCASKYTFGSDAFGGSDHWIIVENGTNPVKVYKVPMPVTRMLKYVSDLRYNAGHDDAQAKARRALGLDKEANQ